MVRRSQPHSSPLRAPHVHASRGELALPWLARLRWGAVAGQLATVAVGHQVLGLSVPLGPVLLLIAVTSGTNLLLVVWLRTGQALPAWLCGALLALDTALLTALLQQTGGPFNPFSILYLVYVALAAVLLGARWTWSLAILSVGCYASLFVLASPVAPTHEHVHGGALSLHLYGMLLAFVVAAILIAHFVVRLSAAVDERDAQIAAIREQAARHQRLAGLTTLAAGAAHELGTPLGTIAIAAKELERAIARLSTPDGASLLTDARLIRAEVDRCRAILDRMGTDAGEARGEAPVLVPLTSLVQDVLDTLGPADATRIRLEGLTPAAGATLPRRAVAHALGSLVRNALDATTPADAVHLIVESDGDRLRFVVRDEGPGMTPEVLARAVEPFFSTKPPGRGMGLGLFLARTLLEGLGGRLDLESAPGRGTTAVLAVPAAIVQLPSANVA